MIKLAIDATNVTARGLASAAFILTNMYLLYNEGHAPSQAPNTGADVVAWLAAQHPVSRPPTITRSVLHIHNYLLWMSGLLNAKENSSSKIIGVCRKQCNFG